jgi:ADP-heptose:LPS heptosyltransferase
MIQKVLLACLSAFEVLFVIFLNCFLKIYVKFNPSIYAIKNNAILVVRLDHKLGDMVIFSDFIKKLHLAYPNKKITLVIHESQKKLYESCPYIFETYYFNWGKCLPCSLPFRSISAISFILKNKLYGNWHFGIANRFDEDFHAPFLLFLSGATERIGFTSKIQGRKKWSMFLVDYLFNQISNNITVAHEAIKNLQSIECKIKGITTSTIQYESWLSSDDSFSVSQMLQKRHLSSEHKIIALGVGAYEDKRKWPAKHFAQLINKLSLVDKQFIFLILGSKSDQEIGDEILSLIEKKTNPNVINFCGLTTIGQTAAILNLTRLFIGNDSGLLHLACANTNQIIEISCHPKSAQLSHANSPIRFGPMAEHAIILQPNDPILPCAKGCESKMAHCITQISVEEVYNSTLILLVENKIANTTSQTS